MHFKNAPISNIYTNTTLHTHIQRRLSDADPILEICDYSTDVMKYTAGNVF